MEITLLRDGEEYKTVTVNSTGDGGFCSDYLPVLNNVGQKCTYTIGEMVVPAEYRKTISGFNVINTVLLGVVAINGTKTWVDDNGEDSCPDFLTTNYN